MMILTASAFHQPTCTRCHEPPRTAPIPIGNVERLIDDLANAGLPPPIVRCPSSMPLFDEKYDWGWQRRVLEAIEVLRNNPTSELWECLVRHRDDTRYFLTLGDQAEGGWHCGSTRNWTVGEFCSDVAYAQLIYPVHRVIEDSAVRGKEVKLPIPFMKNLGEWRKERAGKTLFELQAEMCRRAIDDLPKITGLSSTARTRLEERLESQIRELTEGKIAVFDGFRPFNFPGERFDIFNAKSARRLREVYERSQKSNAEKNGKQVKEPTARKGQGAASQSPVHGQSSDPFEAPE